MIKKISNRTYGFIKLIATIVVIFLIGGFVYTSFYEGVYLKNKIRRKLVIVQNGHFTKWEKLPKGFDFYNVHFYFEYDGKLYQSERKNSYRFDLGKVSKKSFPVAFEKGNPTNAIILIKTQDFEYFNIPYPDSLNIDEQ